MTNRATAEGLAGQKRKGKRTIWNARVLAITTALDEKDREIERLQVAIQWKSKAEDAEKLVSDLMAEVERLKEENRRDCGLRLTALQAAEAKLDEKDREIEAAKRPDGVMVFSAPGWDATVLERARRTEAAEAEVEQITQEISLDAAAKI